ncbi:hypothetical protein ACWNYH_00495 [Candidatus Vidania fulgoroideorum]
MKNKESVLRLKKRDYFIKYKFNTLNNIILNSKKVNKRPSKDTVLQTVTKALHLIKKSLISSKNIVILTNKEITNKQIIKKLNKFKFLIKSKKKYYNGVINKEIKKKNTKLVIIIGTINNKVFKDTNKLGIRSIYLTNSYISKYYKPSLLVPFNEDSEIAKKDFLKQIISIRKDIEYKNNPIFRESFNRFFIKLNPNNKKLVILKIKFKSDLYQNKFFLKGTFNRIILKIISSKKINKKNIIYRIKQSLGMLSSIYNEKIKLAFLKIITSKKCKLSYYLYNNKYSLFSYYVGKKKPTKLLMNIIAQKDIISSKLYKRKSIFNDKYSIKELVKKYKIKKVFFIR